VSQSALLSALGPVLDTLEALGVRHYVGGSLASSAHGIPRTSIDADLLADLGSDDVDAFVAALEGTYYVPAERIRDAVTRRSSFNVIHLATMFKIDVFMAKDRAFDRQALARARPEPLEGDESRLVPLASAEDVVLAKLEWYRKGDEVSERQWTDVLGVLRSGAGRLDLAYLRRIAGDLNVLDLLDRALAEAGPGG
jgi:hypothetical protein